MNRIACGYCMGCTEIADLTARAERAEAELARQVAARVAVDVAENAEIARLRAALLKVYECEGCRHCTDLAGTVLDGGAE